MSVATAAHPAPTLGALEVDPTCRRASVAGAELYLSEGEFKLLAALAAEPGRAFSYKELLAGTFAGAPGVSVRTIASYGDRLSRKLELRGMAGWLCAEAGVGMRLEPACRETAGSRVAR